MTDRMSDNPPITQVAITVQFTPALGGMSMLDVADLYANFRSNFPLFAHLPRAGTMTTNIAQVDGVMPGILARAHFISPQLERQIFFQDDRFTYSWHRQGSLRESANYPGFDVIMNEFLCGWQVMLEWLQDRFTVELTANVGEVAYEDAFELVEDDNSPRRMSTVFEFLSPSYSGPPLRGASYSWREPLPDGATGFVGVSIQTGHFATDGIPVATLDTTVRLALVELASPSSLAESLQVMHEAATGTFSRVVKLSARLT